MTYLLNETQQSTPFANLFLLTNREWEVLLLLTENFSPGDAANLACITRKSFHNYKNRICRKLGLSQCSNLAEFIKNNKKKIQDLDRIYLKKTKHVTLVESQLRNEIQEQITFQL